MLKSQPSRETLAWVGLLVIAMAVRWAACGYWSSDLRVDRDAYLGIARNIRSGNGFCSPDTSTPTAYRPPVYPFLLAVGELLVAEPWAVAMLNIASGMAMVAGVWRLLGQWWQAPLGMRLAAGLALSVDPLLSRYTAQPMTECVFTALVVWTIVGVSALYSEQNAPADPNESSARRADIQVLSPWLTGIVAGMAILCRPTFLPFIGLVSVGMCARLLLNGRWKQPREWFPVAKFAVGWCVLIGVWATRNQLVMGHPILTTTHGGYTLLLGNNSVFYDEVARRPWGTVWEHESLTRWQTSLAAQLDQEYGPRIDEVTADAWHQRQATQAMRSDPAGFWSAMLYRIRSFWSLAPRGPEETSRFVSRMVAGWYSALFLLSAIGFANAVRQRHPAVLIGGLLILTVAVLHLFYWTDTRMRAPLHPVLVTFAAAPMRRRK